MKKSWQTIDKEEVIVEVRAEGGSMALTGKRHARGWTFSRLIDESVAYELLDEKPIIDQSADVYSWQAALRLLDKYPWQTLYPLNVHPEFRAQVWIAIQERTSVASELERWRNLCT
jgi:transposase